MFIMVKPYKENELDSFLLEFHNPLIPALIVFIINCRKHKEDNSIGIEDLEYALDNINEVHHAQRFDSFARPEAVQLEIDRGKEALKKIDQGEILIDREKIEKRLRLLEDKKKLIDIDRILVTEITDKFLEETIKNHWSSVEFHYDLLDIWRYIFESVTFNKDDIPEGKFTLYRAGTKEGFSWTDNLDIAKRFHSRNKEFPNYISERNYLLKLDVTKDDVLFYESDRSEDEYVLIPDENKIEVIPHS